MQKKLVVKFAKLATLHICQACLPCIQRLHAVLLAAMAKAPATFFIAVSKVSSDAVTSMPSASAIEIKHCQPHHGVVTFLAFLVQKLQKHHNPNDFRHWQGCSTLFCLLLWVSSATLWQASSLLSPSLPWLLALLLPWPLPWHDGIWVEDWESTG